MEQEGGFSGVEEVCEACGVARVFEGGESARLAIMRALRALPAPLDVLQRVF